MNGEFDALTKIPVDEIDALMAINRQTLILEMVKTGKLDDEAGMELYADTTRPDIVAADRQAWEKGEFGPNSPTGILGILFFKLAPQENPDS